MKIIILIIIIMFILINPFFRYVLKHPILCLKNGFNDIKDYIIHKRRNECPYYGRIFTFCASDYKAFGSGKTLSMIEWLVFVYQNYNGLPVWDDEKQEFVMQRIIIISNVELKSIPYIPFRGKEQFVNIDKLDHTEHDIILFAIDEAGQEFNSREYKTNLPTQFLTRLLQVRHNRIGICMTSQRFSFIDKTLRSVCNTVTCCRKKWRIVMLQDFDAYALENCPNPDLIRPYRTRFYFATNDLYNAYDTTYNVEKLKEDYESGQFLNTEEIFERIKSDGDILLASRKFKKSAKIKK